MKQKIFLIIIILCSAVFSQNPSLAPPSWVSNRPVSASRFIGIGVAEKTPGSNYMMEAKKNALYDMASEIKVNISSNSMLYSYQNNNQFNQTYNSLIKLSNTENIEGYQQAGTYENEKQYWVYYYLEKEEYFRRKEQKKQQTLQQASQLLSNADRELKSGNFTNALLFRLKAFGVLIPYMNEEVKLNPLEAGGISNPVQLFQLIQNQLDAIAFQANTTSFDVIPLQKTYQDLEIKFTNHIPYQFAQLPFFIEYNEEEIRPGHEIEEVTANNVIKFSIEKIMKISGDITIHFTPDLEALSKRDTVALAGAMLAKQILNLPKKQITLRLRNIMIYYDFQLQNFSKKISTSEASSWDYTFKEFFKGLPIQETNDPKSADFIITCIANTSLDADNQYLFSSTQNYLAELKAEFILKNAFQKEIYRHSLNQMHGYDKDKFASGLKAYLSKKAKAGMKEAALHIQRNLLDF
ncbi:MAG: LPP20 family lipoprotein [Bacteroidia bacterium]|nr:LPP20 family lipoprotein [Bacteroidia bacterium]